MPSRSTRGAHRFSLPWLAAAFLFLGSLAGLHAETVATLPAPTSYVSDFANVIDPGTRQQIEALCTQLDQQAHTQFAIVTVHNLGGDDVDDFAVRLEEKWKVGAKGTDRGLLLLLAVDDRKWRIEVGYGLEGILNDAKTGDIGRSMVPLLRQQQYGTAVALATQQLAQVVADDAHITLTPIAQPPQPQHESGGSPIPFLLIILGVLFLIGIGAGGGPGGLFYFLLGSAMGGIGRNDRYDDGHTGGWFGGGGGGFGGGGGGFGGFGGGGSGGGGASGGW